MAEGEERKQDGAQDDPWMSINEAAERLGVSRQTVYARASRGELGSMVVAGRTVISRDDVQAAAPAA